MTTPSRAPWQSLATVLLPTFREDRRYVFAGLGFLLLFLLLLSHAPLTDSFYGSVDNLFVPVLGNTVVNLLRSSVTGEFVGRAMYPANILAYGETAFGTGLLFVALRFIGASDVLAVYIVQVVLLTLMAVAATVLAERLTGSFQAGLLAAFIFTTTNFVWADIDNLPIHFYFFPLLSLYFLIKAAEDGDARALVIAGILGGVQAYFSLQVFAYQSLLLSAFGLAHFRSLWRLPGRQRASFAFAYALIGLPLILFYLNTVIWLNPQDAWPRSVNEAIYQLHLPDLTAALPGKAVAYGFVHESPGGLTRVAHSAFPGLVAPVLALLGLLLLTRNKVALLLVGTGSLLFSLGTTVEIAGRTWDTPLVLFYRYVPLSQYLRVGLRAYTLVLLALSILAGFGWARILKFSGVRLGGRLRATLLAAVLAFIAAENISWPVNAFELLSYPRIPPGYVQYFLDKPQVLILDMPSQSTEWPFYTDDVIYALWQTKHKRNIMGGVNGYYPPSRLEVQDLTDRLPSTAAFRELRAKGLTHIVWHKSEFLVCRRIHAIAGCHPETGKRWPYEQRGPGWLTSIPFLHLVHEDQDIVIYAVADPPDEQSAATP